MGQICMWEEIPSQSFEDIITRDRIVGYIFPTVYSVFSLFFFFKVKDCVNSQCLSRTTFGSVGLQRDRNRLRQINVFRCYGGKYRRNLLNFSESLKISCLWSFFIIMENTLLMFVQRFSASLSSRTIFMIYYTFTILLIQLYHGLWLPCKYLMISREEYYQLWAEGKTKQEPREVRTERIEPRRDFYSRRVHAEKSTEQTRSRFSYARRETTNTSTTINIGPRPGQTVVQVEVEI